MTGIILQMQSYLRVEIGMRVICDSHFVSGESLPGGNFFQKYRHTYGTIAGFSTEYAGPLDSKGRLPGTYYTSDGIDVRFDGEDTVHTDLNIKAFILISTTTTTSIDSPLTHQWVGELPNPIEFYPDDIVRKADDLLQTERVIESVDINKDGSLVYTLAETKNDRVARKNDHEKILNRPRKSGDWLERILPRRARTEHCFGKQLVFVKAGNVRRLYKEPTSMYFDSPSDELRFWARDGISSLYFGKGSVFQLGFSLNDARHILEAGECDIIVCTDKVSNHHQIYKLHNCFEQHRNRVRTLAHSLKIPPNEIAE